MTDAMRAGRMQRRQIAAWDDFAEKRDVAYAEYQEIVSKLGADRDAEYIAAFQDYEAGK